MKIENDEEGWGMSYFGLRISRILEKAGREMLEGLE